MAKDIVINYSSGEILEPKKNLTLGERFFSGGNPLPEDPTKPINPWAPKPIGPVLPNKQLAELTNMNTPDLEQSPDSFLRPGETLEDWDVTFRRPNAYGGLQRTGFANGPPKWSGTKNLPFNKRDAWRKNFVDKLVKWIIKKIKKFNKTALPGEVPNISVNNILRDMGYSPSEAAGTIRKSPPTTLRNYIT